MKDRFYKSKWEMMALLLLLSSNFFYFFYVQDLVESFFVGTAPEWFEKLATGAYPRLTVEKSRFSADFFLEKTFQLVLRWNLVVIGFLIFSTLLKHSKNFKFQVDRFWSETIHAKNLTRVIAIFHLGLIVLLYDWAEPLYDFLPLVEFYEPTLIYKALQLPFPSRLWLSAWIALFTISGIFLVVFFGSGKWNGAKKTHRLAVMSIAIANTLVFVLLQGYYLCYGKIVHTYSPIIYASLLLPFLTWEVLKSGDSKQINSSQLKLIQLAISFCYLFSGLEKLLTSGVAWLNPAHFKLQLDGASQQSGLWLLENAHWAVSILPTLTVLFQLGFVCIVFLPKLRWLFLPVGFFFHLGTFLLLGVGWWLHPWLLSYIFFFNWNNEKNLTPDLE